MNCKKCGMPLQPDEKFCGNCGAPVEKEYIVCPMCGRKQESGGVYCEMCGYALQSQEKPFDFTAKDTSENKSSFPYIIVIVLLAVILCFGGVLLFILMGSGSSHRKNEPITLTTATEPPAAAPVQAAPTPIPKPVFAFVTASSTRKTDTEGGQYSAEAVLTLDNLTKWAPVKGGDGGVNEWIQISSNEIQHVSGIEILNGYQKTSDVWRNNNRVKDCTISFSDGSSRTFLLEDTMSLIKLDLGGVVDTTYVRLTINSLYKGIKWNDTAITYLGAY